MVSDLSPVILQHDLDGLFKWSMDWHMTFNVAKCKTLHFSKKKFPTDQSEYHLGGQPLERVSAVKDLGVSVSCDLKWGRHIAQIVSKSNKILGLINDVVATHRQTYFRSSFFPRSVNIWNNLPSALKNSSSLPSLKTALFNLYLSKLPSYQPP